MSYYLSPENLATIQAGMTHVSAGNATAVENSIVIPPVISEPFIFQSGGLNVATEPSPYIAPASNPIAEPDLSFKPIVYAPVEQKMPAVNDAGRAEILYHISQVAKISPQNEVVIDVIHQAVNESVNTQDIKEVTQAIADTSSLNVNPVTLINVFKEDAPAVAQAIQNGEPLSEPVVTALIENNIVTEPGKQPIAPVQLVPVTYPEPEPAVGETKQRLATVTKAGLLDRLTNYFYKLIFNK